MTENKYTYNLFFKANYKKKNNPNISPSFSSSSELFFVTILFPCIALFITYSILQNTDSFTSTMSFQWLNTLPKTQKHPNLYETKHQLPNSAGTKCNLHIGGAAALTTMKKLNPHLHEKNTLRPNHKFNSDIIKFIWSNQIIWILTGSHNLPKNQSLL